MVSHSTAALVSKLLAPRSSLPPLVPKQLYQTSLQDDIKSLDAPNMLKASLHLANDDWEQAHLLAQDMEGDRTADLMHAIVHRREGERRDGPS